MKLYNGKIKFFFMVVILIIFYLFSCNYYEPFINIPDPNIIKKLNNTVVRISASLKIIDWTKPYSINTSIAVGTGFFINSYGYILTCSHVIENSYKLEITIPGISQTRYNASIIAIYPERDLALLKIDNYKNTDFLKLGNSDDIEITQNVTAVGYMLASEQLKITKGTVSGYTNNVIQTDTVINPGNSGGPLLNSKYEVIGINASKTVSYGVEGVNYAVPINQYIINEKEFMIKESKVKIIRPPRLGVLCSNVNDDLLKYYGIVQFLDKSENIGYIINKIAPESPAFISGLEIGDIIIKFDDYLIDNYGMTKLKNGENVHLDYLLYNKSSTDSANITVIKKSTKNIISSRVDFKNNDFYKIKYLYSPFDNVEYKVIGGIVMMNLMSNHLDIFKCNRSLIQFNDITKKNENKVIITSIIPGSKVQSLNIFKPGSLIKSINGIKVNNIFDIDMAIKNNNLLDSNNNKYIEIIDEQNMTFIINIEDAIKEDNELSYNNNYTSIMEKYR